MATARKRRPGYCARNAARPVPARTDVPRRKRLPNRAAALNPCIGGNTAYNQPYTGVCVPSERITPTKAIAHSIATRRLASTAGSAVGDAAEDHVRQTATSVREITTTPGKKL